MLRFLEHVNLNVVDRETPYAFWVGVLGCSESLAGSSSKCESSFKRDGNNYLANGSFRQLHINLGLSQLHLGYADPDGARSSCGQRVDGALCLLFKSLDDLRDRLVKGRVSFDDLKGVRSDVKIATASTEASHHRSLTFGCPYGNRIVALEHLNVNYVVPRRAPAPPSSNICGVAAIIYHVLPRVDLHALAESWKALCGEECVDSDESSFVRITSVSREPQSILLIKHPKALSPYEQEIHLAIYVDDYETLTEKMEGEFWINGRYTQPPLSDCVKTRSQALRSKQFRVRYFKNVAHYNLELEVRDFKSHPSSIVSLL